MAKNLLRRKKAFRLQIFASLLLLLSIPLTIYNFTSNQDFDTRSSANDQVDLVQCSISFPFVSPETLESGKTVQLDISANSSDKTGAFQSISIQTDQGEILFEQDYPVPVESINERVTYSPDEIGDVQIFGQADGVLESTPCIVGINTTAIKFIRVQEVNAAPDFTSEPTAADPSNVLVPSDQYSYELTAADSDGDKINFAYSFSPRSEWLNAEVVENGDDGALKIRFSGTADTPASYLVNVFIHDGYSAHLRSQSWVISVEQSENDTPVVTVKSLSSTSINQGDNITVEWSAEDLNQITKQMLFVSKDPGNSAKWTVVDDNLAHNVNRYVYNTSALDPGTYKFIVQAVDNADEPATGTGLSPEFAVGEAPPPEPVDPSDDDSSPGDDDDGEDPDDGVVIEAAQIINISPAEGAEVINARRSITATLVAADGERVKTDSILFKLDGVDQTQNIEISEVSESEITVIYKPPEDLESGEHKVEIQFEDSGANFAEKAWTYSVRSDQSSEDTYTIFGYEIAKRTAMIILMGLAVILLALLLPWLLYLAWRKSDDDQQYESAYYIPPSNLSGRAATRYKPMVTGNPNAVPKQKPPEMQGEGIKDPSAKVAYTPKLHPKKDHGGTSVM